MITNPKIKLFDNTKNCCACMNICPVQAIYMQSDQDGFLYPVIDELLCVKCEKCKQVCAFQKKYTGSLKETYVAVTQNVNVLESASGGYSPVLQRLFWMLEELFMVV